MPHAPMRTARNHLGAVALDGLIYVFGGRVRGENIPVTEVFDTRTNTWRTGAPMPTPRSGYAAAVVRGRIFVMGGELGRPTTYPENEEYDPRANTWASRSPMPTPRHGLTAVVVDDRVYVISGGPRPGGSFSNTNEVYIPD